MAYKITLIPGDGIGPDVSRAAVRCIEATGVKIDWDEQLAGQTALDACGELLPQKTLDSIRTNKVCLKGPLTTPVGKGFRSINVAIRQALDLYSCLRPCRSYQGVRSRYNDIDLVIVRENSEDLYSGIEFEEGTPATKMIIDSISNLAKRDIRPDSGISIKPISRFATDRIVRFAFEYALKNGRRKVTAVHKANIMKMTDGLFLETAREVAREYPDIEFEERIVDNMCMQLVQKPQLYDVLVTPNLYGDILSDLAAGLIGGLGIAPSSNLGDDELAVFEPAHGSAPKYTGLDKVDPTAQILSGYLMLKHIGQDDAAARVLEGVKSVIAEGRVVTYDIGGEARTSEMAKAIVKAIEKM